MNIFFVYFCHYCVVDRAYVATTTRLCLAQKKDSNFYFSTFAFI